MRFIVSFITNKYKGIILENMPMRIYFIYPRDDRITDYLEYYSSGICWKKEKRKEGTSGERGISGSTEERRIVRQNRIMMRGGLTERSLIKPINRMSRNTSVGEFHGLERTVFKRVVHRAILFSNLGGP